MRGETVGSVAAGSTVAWFKLMMILHDQTCEFWRATETQQTPSMIGRKSLAVYPPFNDAEMAFAYTPEGQVLCSLVRVHAAPLAAARASLWVLRTPLAPTLTALGVLRGLCGAQSPPPPPTPRVGTQQPVPETLQPVPWENNEAQLLLSVPLLGTEVCPLVAELEGSDGTHGPKYVLGRER